MPTLLLTWSGTLSQKYLLNTLNESFIYHTVGTKWLKISPEHLNVQLNTWNAILGLTLVKNGLDKGYFPAQWTEKWFICVIFDSPPHALNRGARFSDHGGRKQWRHNAKRATELTELNGVAAREAGEARPGGGRCAAGPLAARGAPNRSQCVRCTSQTKGIQIYRTLGSSQISISRA